MDKNGFLKALEKGLTKLNSEQINNAISFYEEIISGKIENGETEENVVTSLGDISVHIKDLLAFYEIDDIAENAVYEQSTSTTGDSPIHELVFKKEKSSYVADFDDIEELTIFSGVRTVKNVEILKSNTAHGIIEKSKIKFFNDLVVSKQGNKLFIKETSSFKFWIYVACQTLIFISAIILFVLLDTLAQRLMVGSSFLVAWGIISIPHIVFNIKGHALRIYLPDSTSRLDVRNIFGNCELINLNINDISVFTKSGRITLRDVSANNFVGIVDSGSIRINNDEGFNISKFGNMKINTSSGSIKINRVETNSLLVTCNSGSTNIRDAKIDNLNSSCKSGTIKLINCTNLKETSISCTSGSIKAYNYDSIKSLLKVTSGTIKVENIAGSHKDYLINAMVSSGILRINHNVPMFNANYGATKQIQAYATSGTIKLSFKDDVI